MNERNNNESITLSKEEIDEIYHQYEIINKKIAAINSKYGGAAQ